jgi:glycosyltransferase involved in cell wall biosynthesis
LFDRAAFGSDGSLTTYRSIPLVRPIRHRVFLELPKRTQTSDEPRPHSAIFVGRLEERKGILLLMTAWAGVEKSDPSATLTVVGDGPLRAEVRNWAGTNRDQRVATGALGRADVADALAHSAVLTAPSQRSGRWREQIGLPISEGLARGLTVVTTDETGLSSWLAEHGHTVLTSPTSAALLEEAITARLVEPLPRSDVQDSLPPEDGRRLAHRWLHG